MKLISLFYFLLPSIGALNLSKALDAIIGKFSVKNLIILECGNRQSLDTTFELFQNFSTQILTERQSTYQNLVLNYRITKQFILLNYSCPGIDFWLEIQASQLRIFNGSNHWILFDSNLKEFQNRIALFDVNFDTKITFIEGIENKDEIWLYNIWSPAIRRHSPLQVEKIAIIGEKEIKWMINNKRNNLQKIVIRSATLVGKTPRVALKLYVENPIFDHEYGTSRMCHRLLLLMADQFNFTVHPVRTTSWGYFNKETKLWDGQMGLIQQNDADLGTATLLFIPPRFPIIDSSLPAVKYRQFFVFRHPSNMDTLHLYTNPLTSEVWLAILIISALTVFLLIFIKYPDPLFSIIAFLTQQDSIEVFTNRLRFILVVSFLATFMYLQFYSATILGSLISAPPKTINNLDKLLDSNLKLIFEDTPISHNIFKLINNEKAQKIMKQKVTNESFVKSIEEGVALMKKSGYAFLFFIDHSYSKVQKSFEPEQIDELQEVPVVPLNTKADIIFPIQKYSPFKEVIRVGMQTLHETGLSSYWRQKWYERKPIGTLGEVQVIAVDLIRVSTVFYLLIIGYFCSMGIFVVERFIKLIRKLHKLIGKKSKVQQS